MRLLHHVRGLLPVHRIIEERRQACLRPPDERVGQVQAHEKEEVEMKSFEKTLKEKCADIARIEAAHKREVAELRGERSGILKANASLSADNDRLRREVAELRDCLKEAIGVACDGCHLAVWHNRKFVKCKKHSNWKCPFGTERWRKALEAIREKGEK